MSAGREDRPSDLPQPGRASGFHGHIADASLCDLVQMECLAGSRGIVRVTSGQEVGDLFFRDGAVVHATVGSLTGEAAALEMLAWKEGTFRPAQRPWPAKDTIACTWQSLLLRAAHMQDERHAESVVSIRPEGRSHDKPGQAVMETVEFEVTPIEVGGHLLRSEDFDFVLRLDPSGAIVVNRGATEEFGDMVAYACRLTELIGMLLGVERFLAMECAFKKGRCFVVLEEDGEVIALGPRPTTDVKAIRELLGV